uniref:Uncharacterized protein n=1 Tax=Wuchereria bancrofti TaxID=6293 RepID=A0AAF5RTT2_WUCBA
LESTALTGLPLSIHHIEFYVSNALQQFAKKENAQYSHSQWGRKILACKEQDEDFVKHLTVHGDSRIVEKGGFVIKSVEVVADDMMEYDIRHSLLDSKTYRGFFLPEYEPYDCSNNILKSLSSDESIFSSSHSTMKIVLITNKYKMIQTGLAEPVPRFVGMRGQIQVSTRILVDDIVHTTERMKQIGVKFIAISDEYYTDLEARRSYRLNGSDDYETPRMSRLPLNYYRRKWAYEKARKTGLLYYIYFCACNFVSGLMPRPLANIFNIIISVFRFIIRCFWYVINGIFPNPEHCTVKQGVQLGSTSCRSYRLNGSDDYETPRMSRLPLNYYRRKWAYEKARKSESLCNSYFTTVTL